MTINSTNGAEPPEEQRSNEGGSHRTHDAVDVLAKASGTVCGLAAFVATITGHEPWAEAARFVAICFELVHTMQEVRKL